MSPNKRIHYKFSDYVITSDGQVISLKRPEPKYLTPRINDDGYIQYKVQDQYRSIHRLLGECYLVRGKDHTQINHIDGNKLNNSLENLEWCTQRENLLHAMRTGLHPNPEKPVRGTDLNTGEIMEYVSQANAARLTRAQQPNIAKCLVGLRKTAGGLTWEWVNE